MSWRVTRRFRWHAVPSAMPRWRRPRRRRRHAPLLRKALLLRRALLFGPLLLLFLPPLRPPKTPPPMLLPHQRRRRMGRRSQDEPQRFEAAETQAGETPGAEDFREAPPAVAAQTQACDSSGDGYSAAAPTPPRSRL